MTEARHTPGPWFIGDENNACCDVLLGTEHNLTCNMDRRDNNTCAEVISRAEMLANAHLIAAAPDMLEALKDSREALRRAGATGELLVVNAAIAKATGEPSP
jgi:hypothetical protein